MTAYASTAFNYDSIEVASWYGQFCDYRPIVYVNGPDGRAKYWLPGQYRTHAEAVRAARREVHENPKQFLGETDK